MYQSWCEDENMPYQQNAMEMYNVLEYAIVNDKLPSKYNQNLISKSEFEKKVNNEGCTQYLGFVSSRNPANNNSSRSIGSQGDSGRSKGKGLVVDPIPKDRNNQTSKYIIDESEMVSDKLKDENQEEKEDNKVWPLSPQQLTEEEVKQQEIDRIVKRKYLFNIHHSISTYTENMDQF